MLKYYKNNPAITPRLAKSFYCWDKYVALLGHHCDNNKVPIKINNISILPLFVLQIIKNITHEDVKTIEGISPRPLNSYFEIQICTIHITLMKKNKNKNVDKLTFVYNNILFSLYTELQNNTLIISLNHPYNFSEKENTLFSITKKILKLY